MAHQDFMGCRKNLQRINANLHKLQKLVKISVNSLQKLIIWQRNPVKSQRAVTFRIGICYNSPISCY